MVGERLSHFRLLAKLGEGGMGQVYRAEDERLGREVAIKLLPPDAVDQPERRERFLREARTAAAVTHPHIATIHEVDEVDGRVFIAMELVQGETLTERIRRSPLATDELLAIAAEAADALARAHETQVVHRDLKPDNVMIRPDGHVKLLDFGLAKLLDPGPPAGEDSDSRLQTISTEVTREGRILGTVAYMSPEQARGLAVDARSDLFSFGVLLYEMATGRRPFGGATMTDTLTAILRDPPPPIAHHAPTCPRELERIVLRCLEKEPERRYPSARELLVDLEQLRRQVDSHSLPPVEAPRAERPRRLVGPLAAAAVALVTMVALGIGTARWLVGSSGLGSAMEGALAVLPFENLQDRDDDERLGQILQELIINDLSDLAPLRVFSSQRLFDVHRQLGPTDSRTIARDVATEVAERAGASAMLTGTLTQLDGRWIVTSQLVDLMDGTVIESETIDGTDLFSMADTLTTRIQRDLGLDTVGPVDTAGGDGGSESLLAYEHYLVGIELLDAMEFEAAIDSLRRAIEIDPAFGKAYYRLAVASWWYRGAEGAGATDAGEALEELLTGDIPLPRRDRELARAFHSLVTNRFDDATERFTRYVATYDDDKEAWYGLGEARFHGSAGRDRETLRAFERATELDPTFRIAYQHVFDIYEHRKLYDEGLLAAQRLIDSDPTDPTGHEGRARLLLADGRHAELEAAVEEALSSLPDDVARQAFLERLGEKLAWRGERDRAEGFLDRALSLDTEGRRDRVLATLAMAELGRYEFDAAWSHAEEALALDDSNSKALAVLFEVYDAQGRYGEALERAREVVERNPSAHDAYRYWIDAAVALGDREELERAIATAHAEGAGRPGGSNWVYAIAIGRCFDYGQFAWAQELARRAAAVGHEDSAAPSIGLGWAELIVGEVDEAAAQFERAAELGGVGRELWEGQARVAFLQSRPLDAVPLAEKILLHTDQFARGTGVLVAAHLHALDDASAREALERSLADHDWDAAQREILREVAREYVLLGRTEPAAALLEQASALDPNTHDTDLAQLEVAVALRRGELEWAESSIEEGAERWPERYEVDMARATLRLLQGRPREAETIVRRRLERGPHHRDLYELLVYGLSEQGRYAEAVAVARELMAMAPDITAYTLLAWNLIAGGLDVDEGVSLARRAAQFPPQRLSYDPLYPHVPSPEHCLGRAALERGDVDGAIELLKHAAQLRPDRPSIRLDLERALALR